MKAQGKIFIDATGIVVGGGLRLLETLMRQFSSEGKGYFFFLDSRLRSDLECSISPDLFEFVNSSGWARVAHAKRLQQLVGKSDTLFCFNNLPPLFKVRGRTIVFLQNRQILEPLKQKNLSLKERVRLIVQWAILKKNFSSVDIFIVQTPTMKKVLGGGQKILVAPFLPVIPRLRWHSHKRSCPDQYELFYPSDMLSHKNHHILIEALALLSQRGCRPKLKLTFSKERMPMKTQDIISHHCLNVVFLKELSYEEIFNEYIKSDALVFPSLCESFGMPLLEAQAVGLPVIASELDFTKDVVKNCYFFNPLNASSIVEAILQMIEDDRSNRLRFSEKVVAERDIQGLLI